MKRKLGPTNPLYPSLTTIVGTERDGRANFLAVAHVGIMNHGTPQYVSFGINKRHFSAPAIAEHKTFSVNIPSQALMAQTDYVGLVSGKNTDKSELFDVFYGDTPHAPMIGQCPVCFECALDRIIDFDTHDVFVGRIVEVHAEDSVLADGKVDIGEVQPLLFDMQSLKYWSLGAPVGNCWGEGKALKQR